MMMISSSGKKNERKKKTANLKVACGNIRTMQDSEDGPQQCSALVARELAQLDIDIAALSKVSFAEPGSLTEDGTGYYTFFWSGKNKNNSCLSGVSFMIKTSIARKLQNLRIGHCDCFMSLRQNKFATVISVHKTNSAGWNWSKRGFLLQPVLE